jgi:hypothetical protein
VRRVVALFIVSLLVAGAAGLWWKSDAIAVNSLSVSSSSMRDDLAAIASDSGYLCYLQAALNIQSTTTAYGMSPTFTAAYVQDQFEHLAVYDHMVNVVHWSATEAELARARTQYEADLAGGANRSHASCPVSVTTAINALPSSFVSTQLHYLAALTAFQESLPGWIPYDNPVALKAYYDARPAFYDTICISIAYVPAAREAAFYKDQKAGASVAELASKYSVDPSAKHGGAYGCIKPGDQIYTPVRQDTIGRPLNQFPKVPIVQNTQVGTLYLYVAPTSRTPNSFAQAYPQVVIDVETHDGTISSTATGNLYTHASVSVDPAFAKWNAPTITADPLTVPDVKFTPFAGAGLS